MIIFNEAAALRQLQLGTVLLAQGGAPAMTALMHLIVVISSIYYCRIVSNTKAVSLSDRLAHLRLHL